MPPTSHIVKNLVEEIRGAPVGKNWVGQFVKCHGIRLKSLYLRNIDNLRAGAEYAPMFQLFFSVVSWFFAIISCVYCLNTCWRVSTPLARDGHWEV